MKFFWVFCHIVLVVVARENSKIRDAQIRRMLSRDGSGNDIDEIVAGLKRLNQKETKMFKSGRNRETESLLEKLNQERVSDPLPSHDITEINEAEGLSDFLFEGDVLLTPGQVRDLLSDNTGRKKRMAEYGYDFMKFNVSKPIKYTLSGWFDKKAVDAIRTAVQLYNTKTCIKFEENDTDYKIEFVKEEGCKSNVGDMKYFKNQKISIGQNCEYVVTVVHEIAHTLGFVHEQARHDRDAYVKIDYRQVKKGKIGNFHKKEFLSNYSHEYDYGSVMHYGAYYFAKTDDLPTILATDPMYQQTMGHRNPQLLDWLNINEYYGCLERCDQLDCLHDGYTNPNNCNTCICADAWTGDHCETRSPGRGPQVATNMCGDELTPTSEWQTVQVEVGENIRRQKDIQDECFWTIQMDDQSETKVELKVTNVNMEYSGHCSTTGGQIYINNNSRSNPITFCSAGDYAVNSTIVSKGTTVIRGFSAYKRSKFDVEYRIAP